MKLSYEWLKDYVDVKASPEEVAQGLTMSGSEVEAVEEAGEDRVMDLEITSNRPDCLSITGLAREVAAVFDKKLKMPDFSIPEKGEKDETHRIGCTIEATDLCLRYSARIISGVKVKEVNKNIRKRIESLGLRPINNIVDVTNFCLMELGQPMHAFDLDKIKGNKIIVREAVKGESITTIDEIQRKLKPGMLVIADEEGPIAVAGVMGGSSTEVGPDTKNILLESAYFNPISVRATARELGISTDSSYRFERGVDKGMVVSASSRAVKLILEESGGKLGTLYDVGEKSIDQVNIALSAAKAAKIIGVNISESEIIKILRNLGMTVEQQEESLNVKVPSFREDLTRDVDLIEEITRIYGYDNIPSKVSKITAQIERKEPYREVLEKTRKRLSALGMNEIMTYSLINETAAEKFPSIRKEPVKLNNPLSEEQKVLTPHLLDGMLKAIAYNINRQNKDLKLYEIGKAYSRAQKEGFAEETTLCLGVTGLFSNNWQSGKKSSTFYDLKGIAEALFSSLQIDIYMQGVSLDGFSLGGDIMLQKTKKSVGFIGEASIKTTKDYDIEQPVYLAQINLDRVKEEAVLVSKYQGIPKYPFSSRDISILCDKELSAGKVSASIKKTGEDLIKEVQLVDMYEGKQVPEGKKSLTYSIQYGLDTRTLKEEEIEAVHSDIKKALEQNLKVSFR